MARQSPRRSGVVLLVPGTWVPRIELLLFVVFIVILLVSFLGKLVLNLVSPNLSSRQIHRPVPFSTMGKDLQAEFLPSKPNPCEDRSSDDPPPPELTRFRRAGKYRSPYPPRFPLAPSSVLAVPSLRSERCGSYGCLAHQNGRSLSAR